MKLVNSKLDLKIDMKENNVDVIVVEDNQSMVAVVSNLWKQCNGEEGEFVLSENGIIKFNKNVDMIINPFELNFNNKKISSALFNELSEIGNEFIEQKSELNTRIIELIDNIILKSSYLGIEYSIDFMWNDLFKMVGIKIDEEYDSLLSKLVEYMKIISKLCKIKILILVNIKAYLTIEEIEDLYINASYNKIQLVLIESYEKEKLDGENVYIIDNDKCVIIKQFI